jgi:hypothetical protein
METEKKSFRLYIERNELGDFKYLQEEKDSPFYKKDNKEVFIAAMIVGFKNDMRKQFQTRQEYIWSHYLNDEELSIIKALAINKEKSLTVLNDKEKVFQIAGEYASGGIKYLKDSIFNKKHHGSYLKRLESELLDVLENFQIEDSKDPKE